MKGWEALKALQEGKYIHEYEYPSPYGAFFLDGKNLRLKCVKKTEEHDVGYVSPSLWDFKISDFLSKQWKIYEEPEDELEPCPLCGNTVFIEDCNPYGYPYKKISHKNKFHCLLVDDITFEVSRQEEVIKLWNTRA